MVPVTGVDHTGVDALAQQVRGATGTMPSEQPPAAVAVQVRDPVTGEPVPKADITWIVDGQVSQVEILRNNSVIRAPAPVTGSMVDCPPGYPPAPIARSAGPTASPFFQRR